jgi:hypothetical protein
VVAEDLRERTWHVVVEGPSWIVADQHSVVHLLESTSLLVNTDKVARAILELEYRPHCHRSDVASYRDHHLRPQRPKDILPEDHGIGEEVVANGAQDTTDDHFAAARP